MDVNVELLVNPFCMADRDSETVTAVCDELGVSCQILNIWDMDEQIQGIPAHVATLVREYRAGKRPGSVYSSVFVNGERLLLNKWSSHLETLKDMIVTAAKEQDQ